MADEVPNSSSQGQPSAAIPWYRSKIMQGIVTGIALQILKKLESKYQLDLSAFGVTDKDVVSLALDALTAAAVAYTAHARVVQAAAPQIVLTKNKADVINAQTPPVTDGQQSPKS